VKNGLDRRGFLKVATQGAAVAGMAGLAGRAQIPGALAAEAANIDNPSAWVSSLIKNFTATSPLNSLKNPANQRAWDAPLVGFSGGDDPLYALYKEKVGPFHWTPLEIFQRTFPGTPAKAEELTVISWILPQTELVKADLRKETKNPAERWVRARMYGELFNEELRRYVAESLTNAGHLAVAPTLSPDYKTEKSERYGSASTFSERHAAYAAGLGTFGLCDGLITPKGKAMRCGAVVARIQITPTPRPYDDHHAYCLFYTKGTCGVCIERCPGGAISRVGHDKSACSKQLAVTSQYSEKQFGIPGYGCGFCQTGTPCESRIPPQGFLLGWLVAWWDRWCYTQRQPQR
jgi:epoxyqueuosine reductase